MQKKAIIIGATGLVGQKLLKELHALYDQLIVLARRPPASMSNTMHFYQLNTFSELAHLLDKIDLGTDTDAFSCLGTTKKQAGSKDAFRQVDYQYNVDFAKLCHQKKVQNFFLLSATGADPNSKVFYSKVKGETEIAIKNIGFQNLSIFRPALLLGKHADRPIENIMQNILSTLSPLIPESLPLHPISARRVAISMAMIAHELYQKSRFRQMNETAKIRIISNQEMLEMTKIKS